VTQLTSIQLQAGIETIANDVVTANIHWKLVKGIDEAALLWPLTIPQSNTFWTLTVTAHVNMAILTICRVFDQENSSLHLLGLLRLIEKNISLFDQDQFRDRLRNNPFVSSLAETARRPDATQLSKDIALCSDSDPLIKLLQKHRGTALAHHSKKRRLNSLPLPSNERIADSDFEILLKRADDILNRYCAWRITNSARLP